MAPRRTATAPSANGSSTHGSAAHPSPAEGAPAPASTGETQPLRSAPDQDTFSEWITRAIDQGVRPEQALAFIGLGLMRRMGSVGVEDFSDGLDGGEPENAVDLAGLRQRLEITELAIRTGAPLSTAEVAQLMGARPGARVVERGGLTARRLGRNVWTLSRSSDEERNDRGLGFSEGFRRRL
jgi:hypothetical protein